MSVKYEKNSQKEENFTVCYLKFLFRYAILIDVNKCPNVYGILLVDIGYTFYELVKNIWRNFHNDNISRSFANVPCEKGSRRC